MARHRLKTWPAYYDAVASGSKKFEVRVNDRDFQPGDRLILACYDPGTGTFDGRELEFTAGYVLHGGVSGIKPGYVVMSLTPVPEQLDDAARRVYEAYAHALGTDRSAGGKTWDQVAGDRRRAWLAVAAAMTGAA